MVLENADREGSGYEDLLYKLTEVISDRILSFAITGKLYEQSASELDPLMASRLNRSYAFFLHDSFGCMNASIIFRQISTYLRLVRICARNRIIPSKYRFLLFFAISWLVTES